MELEIRQNTSQSQLTAVLGAGLPFRVGRLYIRLSELPGGRSGSVVVVEENPNAFQLRGGAKQNVRCGQIVALNLVDDAGWLRQLQSYGLLRGSFRPEAELATLRAFLRQRERLVAYAAAHIQHIQKALMEMNLQVHHVVSDITGATGLRIIRAIVAGERDPDVLASFRDIRCHSSIEVIKAALVGNDRDEHIFALTQSLDLYDFYQARIEECDRKLEAAVAALAGLCCTNRLTTGLPLFPDRPILRPS